MKLSTRTRSLVMRVMTSNLRRNLSHFRGRLSRNGIPRVYYFHQVDDPYSHLAVQKLDMLRSRYKVDFECHLVSLPATEFQGDSTRFSTWAVSDARSVAHFYGTELPTAVNQIDAANIKLAQGKLAGFLDSTEFASVAIEVGNRLWRNEAISPDSTVHASNAIDAGNQLRQKLGHYLGAMFYFEGEWYWGLDRMFHLERRLCAMNLSSEPEEPICVPRPEPESATGKNASSITMEFFPSLRSPYTAISFDRTIDLVRRSGVTLQLKPVLPMMMRGVPAPREKQMYIVTDTTREADAVGVSFGKVVDPFGEPVKRAFSLFPFLVEQGKAVEFCSNYLKAAWAEAVDITTDEGLREVVERSGVSWTDAEPHLGTSDWESILESNVSDMLAAGLWGVPSYRITGGNDTTPFSCWGQDRLWRVETEISRRVQL